MGIAHAAGDRAVGSRARDHSASPTPRGKDERREGDAGLGAGLPERGDAARGRAGPLAASETSSHEHQLSRLGVALGSWRSPSPPPAAPDLNRKEAKGPSAHCCSRIPCSPHPDTVANEARTEETAWGGFSLPLLPPPQILIKGFACKRPTSI